MNKPAPQILVVEDDDFNRSVLIRHLTGEGYGRILEAADGKAAYDILRRENVDLILSDIQMPEMDGFALLKAIKSDMRLRNTPIIMISSVDDIESIVKCIELGAEDYLPKPFNKVLLRARVEASLEKKRLRNQETAYLSELRVEKRKSDQLLGIILPAAAASELKATNKVMPRRFQDVAILFCDVVGFTSFCDRTDAVDVVARLQSVFERCEEICNAHGMEKIKTIGDAFMATSGMLKADPSPLRSAIRCGLDMAKAVVDMNIGWEFRSGVHCGAVVGGIVGRERYQYDVWGDTVNTAARMCGVGAPGTVALAYDNWLEVQDDFDARSLGRLDIKGKGSLEIVECYGLR